MNECLIISVALSFLPSPFEMENNGVPPRPKRRVKAMISDINGKQMPRPVSEFLPVSGMCPIKTLSTMLYNNWASWAIISGTACLRMISVIFPSPKLFFLMRKVYHLGITLGL